MIEVKELTIFYNAINDDPRIGITHICVYMALFQFFNLNGFQNPVNITRQKIMEVSKISGVATFHKCIKELHTYGYIEYVPSYNPMVGSRVFLLKV
jgi:hypothetical protein